MLNRYDAETLAAVGPLAPLSRRPAIRLFCMFSVFGTDVAAGVAAVVDFAHLHPAQQLTTSVHEPEANLRA